MVVLMGAWLLGRVAELEVLASALDVIQGGGSVIVLRGEPGIGKSALLDAASLMASERGIDMIRMAGVQAEGDLPFACLHQVLRPVLGHLVELPEAQRGALETAFGMARGPAPELFLIALAGLQLLANAADHRPLALLVDDAQWLDKPSADALAFVARRIFSDRIVMVIAIREGHDSPLLESQLTELYPRPLEERDALELIRARYPDLAPDVTARLLEEAAGNPLALLELPVALESEVRGGHARLPDHLPLTSRLERAFS
jgi:predicted ATPase